MRWLSIMANEATKKIAEQDGVELPSVQFNEMLSVAYVEGQSMGVSSHLPWVFLH